MILDANLIIDVFVEYPSTQNVTSSISGGNTMANPVLQNAPIKEMNRASLGMPIARPARRKEERK